MKIKSDFLLKKVADQNVVVPTGNSVLNFNAAITLNETAAFLFEQLKEDCDEQTLIQRLTDEYAVDKKTAEDDVRVFLSVLKEHEILE